MKITIVLLILIQLLLPGFVLGHGFGGSIEQQVGEYLVYLGYNTYSIESGTTISLDFDLFDLSRQPMEFAEVLVEISKDEQTLLSVYVPKPEYGWPIVDYVFPEPGNYQIELNFVEKDEDGFNKVIVGATFDFPVEDARPWYRQPFLIATIIVTAAGVAAAVIANRSGKTSRK